MTYTCDLQKALKKCDREEIDDQPLYIDEGVGAIKCQWCPAWCGSQTVKVINQHVRKSKSHKAARMPEVVDNNEGAGQLFLTDFFPKQC